MTLLRLAATLLCITTLCTVPHAHAGDGKVVLIHSGDIHGHLVAAPERPQRRRPAAWKAGWRACTPLSRKLRADASEHGVDRSAADQHRRHRAGIGRGAVHRAVRP
ncbi:MAG: hypothetical protein MZV65_37045 [Chromatiales bacterium]|nr:hypothetical protein [Chromatiales bacterium]